MWDWAALKTKLAEHGMRNSLLVAPMPTASTAQILGNNESIEPYTSNIYTRRVLSGEFQVVNTHLLTDLTDMGIWSEDLRQKIVANGGSVQGIPEIPTDIQALYKTVWEISQVNAKFLWTCTARNKTHMFSTYRNVSLKWLLTVAHTFARARASTFTSSSPTLDSLPGTIKD